MESLANFRLSCSRSLNRQTSNNIFKTLPASMKLKFALITLVSVLFSRVRTDEAPNLSFCDKVVPYKSGHIVKFIGRNANPHINSTMDLYLKEGKLPGGLTGIFKNINQMCIEDGSRCVPGFINTEYVENNPLNIRCSENNWFDSVNQDYRYSRKGPLDVEYLYAARKIYMWLPFGYQKQLLEKLQSPTGLNGQPMTVQVNSHHPECRYIFTASLASWRTPKGELKSADGIVTTEVPINTPDSTPVVAKPSASTLELSAETTPLTFEQSVTTETVPVTSEKMSETIKAEFVTVPSETKGEVYVLDGYSNETLCDYLLYGAPFKHRVKILLNKDDLTLRKWKSELESLDADYFSKTELEFDELIPAKQEKKVFEDRRLPDFMSVASMNLCNLLRFQEGFDTKMKVNANIWNTDLELDLLMRPVKGYCAIVLVKILPPSVHVQRRITDHYPQLLELIGRPAVLSFDNKGALLFEFLGGKRIEYFVKYRNLDVFTQSVRLEFDGIHKIVNAFEKRADGSEDLPVFSYVDDNFVVPFPSVRRTFKAYHYLQCTEASPTCWVTMNVTAAQDTYAGTEQYELTVVNKVSKKDKKLDSFSSSFKLVETVKLGEHVKQMNLTVSFDDFVERENGKEAFELFNDVINEHWFSKNLSPYDLPTV